MSAEIRFSIPQELHAEYAWTIEIFGTYIGFTPVFVEEDPQITVAAHAMADITVSHFFKQTYLGGDHHFKAYFRNEPLHLNASRKPDHLSTAFYLLAFAQEYIDYRPDNYGRFPYALSLQKHFDCIERNLVAEYFDALYAATPKLQALVQKKKNPTKFFLSHDIDSLYGCLRNNRKYLLQHGKIGTLLQLMMHHYLQTPDYMLLDKICKMEKEADVRSVFFWLVYQGRGNRKIMNADYYIRNAKVKKVMEEISGYGSVHGLHKAVSRDGYAGELKKSDIALQPINRNHYLLAELPDTFDALEKGGIAVDCTMGFADAIGFRNSYGLPYRPFSLKEKRAYSFLELPLHIMDTTLKHYMHLSSAEAGKKILDFLDGHKENAIISILWHNNYFFDMDDTGWLEVYKQILGYIKDSGSTAVSPMDLVHTY